MMLRGFHDAYQSAQHDLANLPAIEELNCLDEISDKLSHHNFDNQFVRWYGIAKAGKVLCRGPRIGIELSDARVHHVDAEWSLISIRSPDDTDKLMVGQRRGELMYLAMLEPLLFDFMHEIECKACVSDQFIVRAEPRVEMISPPASGPSAISYTVEKRAVGHTNEVHSERYTGVCGWLLTPGPPDVHGNRCRPRTCSRICNVLVSDKIHVDCVSHRTGPETKRISTLLSADHRQSGRFCSRDRSSRSMAAERSKTRSSRAIHFICRRKRFHRANYRSTRRTGLRRSPKVRLPKLRSICQHQCRCRANY